MLNAAIVGLGWWGKNLVNAVQDKSERIRFIHGVSKEPEAAREFASTHDFRLSTELRAVLDDPRVEAVVLATPHSLHADQIVQVADAGKPVFCEKPLALVTTRPAPDPLDTVSVLFKFENGLSGFLGAVRATPVYWRGHVFGSEGSAEALGETGLVLRTKGAKAEHRTFDQIDSLRAELEAFADAVAGRAPYPITAQEMIDTIAAFEATIRSIENCGPVRIGG